MPLAKTEELEAVGMRVTLWAVTATLSCPKTLPWPVLPQLATKAGSLEAVSCLNVMIMQQLSCPADSETQGCELWPFLLQGLTVA